MGRRLAMTMSRQRSIRAAINVMLGGLGRLGGAVLVVNEEAVLAEGDLVAGQQRGIGGDAAAVDMSARCVPKSQTINSPSPKSIMHW